MCHASPTVKLTGQRGQIVNQEKAERMLADQTIDRCGNCKFYNIEQEFKISSNDGEDLHPVDYEAECRRYPPKKICEDTNLFVLSLAFEFPIVTTINWCGEHKRREST